jgi:peptidoglycan DL-endopeptidase CwlO
MFPTLPTPPHPNPGPGPGHRHRRPGGGPRHARPRRPPWGRRSVGALLGTLVLTAAAPAPPHPISTQPTSATSSLTSITARLARSGLLATQATDQLLLNCVRADATRTRAATESAARVHHDTVHDTVHGPTTRQEGEAAQPAAQRSTTVAARSAARAAISPVERAPSATAGVVAVLDFLKAQLGKPYVMGGTGPSSYDCSGLVQAAFRTIGVDLPRVSQAQSTAGTPVSLSDLQAGDVLYWGSAGDAYHVAVYVGDGEFIGAQNPSTGIVERPLSYDEPTGAVRIGGA